MKVLFDSNILIDVILHRGEFFAESRAAMLLIEEKIFKGYVSASAITDIYYIVRKELKDSAEALETIKQLLRILKVTKVNQKSINMAVRLEWKDFEDSVQYCAARCCGVKCILTRDKEGFSESAIPVLSPKEFFQK